MAGVNKECATSIFKVVTGHPGSGNSLSFRRFPRSMRLGGSPFPDWQVRGDHTQTHAHEMDTEQTSGLGIPITRSRACSCSSCCCKISSCLCSSSSCRLMYSWRGRQQRMQRNTTRGKGREKEPVISKVRRNCQVKCGSRGKNTQTPLH